MQAFYRLIRKTKTFLFKISMEDKLLFLEGRGGYTNIKKDVLLVVVSRREEVHLKKLVNEIDPMAFIIINDAHEVLGEGFSKK